MSPLQVPGHADQIPLSADGLHPSEQELAESPDGLDDAEDRFDGAFPFAVEGPTVLGLQSMLHLGHGIGVVWQRLRLSEAFFETLVVRVAWAADIRLNLMLQARADVGSAGVAGIGHQNIDVPQRLRQGAYGRKCRLDFQLVIGMLTAMPTDNQHRVDIDAGLGVVALCEAAAGSGHDPGCFVGQVALVRVPGAGFRRLGWFTACLLARLLLLGVARSGLAPQPGD